METRLVIIQPTAFCNINCRYCYLPLRSMTRRINPETLSQIMKVFFSSSLVADVNTFVWHAGEPLVLPCAFYEQAFELQRRWNINGARVSNAIQTNATLITQSWCQFFKANDVSVGVSLDGPRHIHDAHRVDRAGRGTFDRVMGGVELLRAHGIKFSVIAVITRDTLQHPDDFWQFFYDLQPASLGLNPEEVEGVNTQSSLSAEEDIEQYRVFFKRLLELNEQSRQPLSIREIDVFKKRIRRGAERTQAQTNKPMAILSFDCDGNISTFAPELLTMKHEVYGNFHFGNVFTDTLENISAHPNFAEVNTQIQQGIARCQQSCEYFAFCGGGSPSNKLHENGSFDSTETVACRLRIKATLDILLKHLEDKYYL